MINYFFISKLKDGVLPRLMGNEKSALSGLEIEEKAIEITDFWLQHSASLNRTNNPQSISVFISEPSLHTSASFGKPSPLERAAKNLMLHRHPCILKYISSWKKGSTFYLATEDAKPLAQVIASQTTLQICIGLHSILRALIFLHEKALASHNNVCSSSVYVTPEGSWKLGGLEYLCRFSDFNQTYLQKIKKYRYEKAIAPEEESTSDSPANPVAIDQYAFGVLTEEVLRLKNADDVPALADFREMCRKYLRHSDPLSRTKLSVTLQHPFFTHDFINIHAFLMELPLKTEGEKENFFSTLVQQLKAFPEKIVAEQLGRLLLSRMVLLDCTAQQKLLPYVLKPKSEDSKDSSESSGLFTISTFKCCLVPKLLQMFCVRDVSIRLLLLSHLNSFIYTFQMDELKSHILPELLVGIKDHDDQLVSTTLRALADLVPILGAAAVIGGKRGKLFTDGRPNHNPNRIESSTPRTVRKISIDQHKVCNEPESNAVTTILELPERLSPDGGEDRIETVLTYAEEESTWSDWETQELGLPDRNVDTIVRDDFETSLNILSPEFPTSPVIEQSNSQSTLTKDPINYKKNIIISDISELDIKHSKSMQTTREEIDFFTDMEPIIEKPRVLHIEQVPNKTKSVFDVENVEGQVENDPDDDGWIEDLNDWGSDNMQDIKI